MSTRTSDQSLALLLDFERCGSPAAPLVELDRHRSVRRALDAWQARRAGDAERPGASRVERACEVAVAGRRAADEPASARRWRELAVAAAAALVLGGTVGGVLGARARRDVRNAPHASQRIGVAQRPSGSAASPTRALATTSQVQGQAKAKWQARPVPAPVPAPVPMPAAASAPAPVPASAAAAAKTRDVSDGNRERRPAIAPPARATPSKALAARRRRARAAVRGGGHELAVDASGPVRLRLPSGALMTMTVSRLTAAGREALRREVHRLSHALAATKRPTRVAQNEPAERRPSRSSATLRMQRLRRKVDELKVGVFMQRARLLGLQELLLGQSIVAARLTLVHRDDAGALFRLERALYVVDGRRVNADARPARGRVVFDQIMTPGPHTVAVTLHYRGNGMGIFPYFEGYRFIVRSSTTINVSAARQTRIVVRAVSQGDITTRVRDKPSVRFDVQSGSLGDTKR